MSKGLPQYDYTLCVACGICTDICPVECIVLKKSQVNKYKTKLYPELVGEEECTSCGLCEKTCPIDAVIVQ